MTSVSLSRHAQTRIQQRGVPHALLYLLLETADIDAPAGGGCRILRVSRKRLKDTSLRERVGSDIDRLARCAVLWCDRTHSIVTVLHHHDGANGRRYRSVH